MPEEKGAQSGWVRVGMALMIGILVGYAIGLLMYGGPSGRPRMKLEVGARYENQSLPSNLLFLRRVGAINKSINKSPAQKGVARLYQIGGMEKADFPKEFLVTERQKDGNYVIIPYEPVKSVAQKR